MDTDCTVKFHCIPSSSTNSHVQTVAVKVIRCVSSMAKDIERLNMVSFTAAYLQRTHSSLEVATRGTTLQPAQPSQYHTVLWHLFRSTRPTLCALLYFPLLQARRCGKIP